MVEAGRRFGIPLSGTMAHSWVMAFAREEEAFRRYADVFQDDAVFLIDTYDTVQAASMIVASGLKPRAVRLDSGDVIALSREVRRILDSGGLGETAIVASGDLDEWGIAEIVRSGAPVDSFGVGTAVSTALDAPSLAGVYKLAEIERDDRFVPVMKKSPGKQTYAGRKQVWRVIRNGMAVEDVLARDDFAPPPDSQPLLKHVMEKGVRRSRLSLDEIRHGCRHKIALLPLDVRRLRDGENYPVRIRIGS
jgi:nicotinate phosphoribosyltransferase